MFLIIKLKVSGKGVISISAQYEYVDQSKNN